MLSEEKLIYSSRVSSTKFVYHEKLLTQVHVINVFTRGYRIR